MLLAGVCQLRPQQFGDGAQGGYLRFQDRGEVRGCLGTNVTVSPVAGWGDRIDPLQFGGVNLVTAGAFVVADKRPLIRRLASRSVNLVMVQPQVGQIA